MDISHCELGFGFVSASGFLANVPPGKQQVMTCTVGAWMELQVACFGLAQRGPSWLLVGGVRQNLYFVYPSFCQKKNYKTVSDLPISFALSCIFIYFLFLLSIAGISLPPFPQLCNSISFQFQLFHLSSHPAISTTGST